MRKKICQEKTPLTPTASPSKLKSLQMTAIAAEPEISHHVELSQNNENFFLLSLADTKLLLGQFWGVKLLQRSMLSVQSNLPFTAKSRKKTL